MRKINAALFITLDGVVEAPGADPSTPPGKRGWSMPYTNDEVEQVIGASMATSDAMLLGRVTYQEFASFWPNMPEDEQFRAIYEQSDQVRGFDNPGQGGVEEFAPDQG